jgi:release factor glutamine methyltransferase
MEMVVSSACLIPRPETELLVQHSIEFLRERPMPVRVLDLCTGSGCIAVAIAKNVPGAQIVATDISDDALSIAAQNIEKHGLGERVQLLSGDLFDPIVPQLDNGRFDLIVSNPPYVTDAEMEALDKNVKDYEPVDALRGGADGLDIIRRIINQSGKYLAPDAALFLEFGYQQGSVITMLLEEAANFVTNRILKDHQNHDRIALAHRQ